MRTTQKVKNNLINETTKHNIINELNQKHYEKKTISFVVRTADDDRCAGTGNFYRNLYLNG